MNDLPVVGEKQNSARVASMKPEQHVFSSLSPRICCILAFIILFQVSAT